ncbi:MAG: heavy metal sensor histidine kinase [Candidatus Kapabacteria bacterium]|nr:heavy metal sensor histidine kinase [Candidatus Kapabacteria bacterium]MDW8011742.1 heavy metal sensor histidine kinase [Bacteroidota bacterium]
MIGQRLSLRARLTLWYGAVVAAVLIGFGLFWYWSVRQELYSSLRHSLEQVARSVGVLLERAEEQAGRRLRPPRHGRLLPLWEQMLFARPVRRFVGPLPSDTLMGAESQVWGAIYQYVLLNPRSYVLQVADTAGRILWRSENLLGDSLPVLAGMTVGEQQYRHFALRGEPVELLVHHTRLAQIAVGYSVREIESVLQRLAVTLLWALPLVLSVSAFGGWLLARASLRPVEQMRRTAESITARNLSLRIPEPPTKDELAHLARTLNQMIARLEASFAQIRQFTADVSHELRTPLTILIGELELALRSRKRPEEYERVLSSVLEEVLRLHRIVETLLELARAESGQVQLERRRVDLGAIVREIAEDIEPLARDRGLSIATEVAQECYVFGDALRLRQAVLNVVDNALKYTPAGGRVTLRVASEAETVVAEVADTGIGIPEEELPQIFERFYRVEKSRTRSHSSDGVGLGLAIVRWIVEAHGGTVEVESAVGQGTRFRFRFPRYEGQDAGQ